MRRLAFAVLLALSIAPAIAGGRGGHNTTFDPNLFGGPANVACLTTAIPGVCSVGYNAVCSGMSDDHAALDAARAAAVAANPARWILYIPPGSHCGFGGDNSFVWDGVTGDAAVSNAVIWAYGATFSTSGGMRVGGASFFEDSAHEAFIASANAGDTTVTLVTAADASIFSAGDPIAATGLELETCCGFPPNFQRNEFRLAGAITGTTTKVIALEAPLKNTLLSTWPSIQSDGAMGNNGPAKIFKMAPSWNINLAVYGITVTATTFVGSQDSIIGRNVQVYDSVFMTENTSFSANANGWFIGSSANGMEVDKDIEFNGMYRDLVRSNLTFQSPSPTDFNGISLTILGSVGGTPWNSTFSDTKVSGLVKVGPSGFYGVGNSIGFNSSSLPAGAISNNAVTASDMTFSAGTLSVAHASSAAFDKALAWGIPDHKYAFADNDGTLNSTPSTTFFISAVRDNGITIFFDMSGCSWGSCGGPLPMPTCNAHACPEYVAYPAATITQRFSGPADLTQFAAPP